MSHRRNSYKKLKRALRKKAADLTEAQQKRVVEWFQTLPKGE